MTVAKTDLAGRRVLVIEDEWTISALLQDMLADIGCEVIGSASRFDDAAEKARSLRFDVAILDLNLDGQKTFAIAEALIERGAAVVFSTGYGAAGVPESLRQVPLLPKPFQQWDLERALRAALSLAS
jgi:CheY-like chemotaxis protein